jgi:hypothetical protein
MPVKVKEACFKAATKAGLMQVSETNKAQSIHINRKML